MSLMIKNRILLTTKCFDVILFTSNRFDDQKSRFINDKVAFSNYLKANRSSKASATPYCTLQNH
jgi:hypothetical protein